MSSSDAAGVARVVRIDGEVVDVVRSMPPVFFDAYLRLIDAGLRTVSCEGIEKSKARRIVRLSTSQVETRGPARSAQAGLSQRPVITDERALALRSRVDRKLRAIARDVVASLDGDGLRSGNRRCTRCRKYAEADWNWCPYDGAATEEIV